MTAILKRRAFLQVAFGALAAGTLLSPDVAKAIEMAAPDKYTRSFVLARNITSTTAQYKKEVAKYMAENNGRMPRTVDPIPSLAIVQEHANAMFDILNKEFECVHTPEAKAAVKELLEGRPDYNGLIYDAENEPYARQMLESVFVIATARDIIRKTRAPLISKQIAMEEFAKKYRDLLV
jgi:hypothetical protein